MSTNPFLPSKSEISSRKVAKFLIELPTNSIPGFVSQIPLKHWPRIVASMDDYTVRASLVTAYVQAIALGFNHSEASGKATTVSRAVRRALRAIPHDSRDTKAPIVAQISETVVKVSMLDGRPPIANGAIKESKVEGRNLEIEGRKSKNDARKSKDERQRARRERDEVINRKARESRAVTKLA